LVPKDDILIYTTTPVRLRTYQVFGSVVGEQIFNY